MFPSKRFTQWSHVLTGLLVACALVQAGPARAQGEDAKLEGFFKAHLEETFQTRPLEATTLGDHRFDARLDDLSPQARAGWLAQTRNRLAALPREVKYANLSRDGQIDFEILRAELVRNVWLAENTRPFEEDPRTYGA